MRNNKIASLESRIARLESKLAGFFYRSVNPELLDFIKKLQKRAPDYYPGIEITLINNPNKDSNDVVLEIQYPNAPQFYKGTFSDDFMYEPLPSIVYLKISSQEVKYDFYNYVFSTDPNFRNRSLFSGITDLDMGKFLVFIKELNKTIFKDHSSF